MSLTTQILQVNGLTRDSLSSEDLWKVTEDWRATADAIVDDTLMRLAAIELDKLLAAKAAHPSNW